MKKKYSRLTSILLIRNQKSNFSKFTLLLLLLFTSSLLLAQTQIGQDINGEAEGDTSGDSVSLSADGSVLAIGARRNVGSSEIGGGAGHVRIYRNVSGTWEQIGDDIDGDSFGDRSGNAVSLSSDGNIVAIGAFIASSNGNQAAGQVRVFQNISDTWVQIGNDIDGEAEDDTSGSSVSLSADGNIVAIGAPGNDENGSFSGHVRVYENVAGTWVQIGADIDGEAPSDQSGRSVSLSNDGTIVAIGAFGNAGNGFLSGHVRVYENVSGTWTQIGDDIDGGELSGSGNVNMTSLNADGTIVAIGGSTFNNLTGHVRVYENVSGTWIQIGDDIDGEETGDRFGRSVSISDDGTIVAIGASDNDGNGLESGSTRIYQNQSGVWTQIGQDIDGEAAEDESGISVSLNATGNIVAISAPLNDGNGIDSGHVRVFDISQNLPEIDILGNGISIVNEDTTPNTNDGTSFDSICIETTRTFTIDNTTGTADLVLIDTAPNFVSISGSVDFTIATQPTSNIIPAGGSTTFEITYTPMTTGAQTAIVSIANNDNNENPYTFDVGDPKSVSITINCPADLTINCDQSTDPSDTGMATASDTCDATPVITFNDVTVDGTGSNSVITRTWTATDANGSSASCDQTITVQDNIAPTINCPEDLTIACDQSTDPSDTGMATASDTCDATPVITFNDVTVDGTGSNSVITRTWTATDANGSSASCDQTITVQDNIAPTINCPEDLTIACDQSTDPSDTGMATASDTCDATPVITFNDVTVEGTGSNSVITRTWTATDANGNSASCDQTITVQDSIAPTINCPTDLTIACDQSTDPSDTGMATASDTCDATPVITFNDVTVDGTGSNSVITRTWTATDANGSSASCDQTITVQDSIAPTINCPEDLTIACDQSTDPSDTGMATASDTCDATPVITFNDVTVEGTGSNSVITRTWTATDANGNSASCDQTITVQDNIAPTINCPEDLTIACDQSTDPSDTGMATASDTCDATPVITFNDVTVEGTGSNSVITRSWTATDANGNSASCDQTITVQDSIAPTINCPEDLTIEATESTVELVDYTEDATVIDNCDSIDSIIITQDPVPGTIIDTGIQQTITLTATDESGNQSNCSFILDVTLGIEDKTLNLSSIIIYPNPAKDVITINNPEQINLNEITIYDMTGRAIQKIKTNSIWVEKSIQLNTLDSAIYLIVIKGGKNIVTRRLIIE